MATKQNEIWRDYMKAAIQACIIAQELRTGSKETVDVVDRAKFAADLSDAAMAQSFLSGRMGDTVP